jgi:hypothetical protein
LAAAPSGPEGKDNPWHGETSDGAPPLRSAARVSRIVVSVRGKSSDDNDFRHSGNK